MGRGGVGEFRKASIEFTCNNLHEFSIKSLKKEKNIEFYNPGTLKNELGAVLLVVLIEPVEISILIKILSLY